MICNFQQKSGNRGVLETTDKVGCISNVANHKVRIFFVSQLCKNINDKIKRASHNAKSDRRIMGLLTVNLQAAIDCLNIGITKFQF